MKHTLVLSAAALTLTLTACSPPHAAGSKVKGNEPTDKATGTTNPPTNPASQSGSSTAAGASSTSAGNPNSAYGLGRGAAVPWIEYQAEDAQTNAKVIGPSRARYDGTHIEAEAIGRKAVRLDKTGDFVTFKATAPGNSLVVRLSIPDAPAGGGIDSTIGVYVDGKRVKSLPVTSRYSWVYGGETLNTPNTPGEQPHTFFDEARTLLDSFPAGAEIRLQRDAEDKAEFYIIDLIDLEQVAPELTMPDGLVSITDFGATANDETDDGPAIQKAINAVIDKKGRGIWIPAGKFIVNTLLDDKGFFLNVVGMEVRGAGMWYSNLTGKKPSLACVNTGGCTFANFAIQGEVDRREDRIPTNGIDGSVGKGTTVDSVWIEHMKVGMWCGSDTAGSGNPSTKDRTQTDGLLVKNSRFRNLYADGINLDNGTKNSIIENNHFRNTGDDSIAIWSYKGAMDDPDENNIARNNTVQMPWRANCFAFYGGLNNTIQDSVCEDVLAYPGLMVGQLFQSHPFGSLNPKTRSVSSTVPSTNVATTIKNVAIIRGGGFFFNTEQGAVKLTAEQGGIIDVVVEDVDIVDSTYSGLQFNTGNQENIKIKNVNISGAGTYGVQLDNNPQGINVTLDGVSVANPTTGVIFGKGISAEAVRNFYQGDIVKK